MDKNNQKNIFVASKNGSSHGSIKQLIEDVESDMHKTKVKKHCYQIAKGLLIRSNVNPETDELLTIFGDGASINNVYAVASWVYEQNPEQNISDSNAVNEYLPKLYEKLEECGITIY